MSVSGRSQDEGIRSIREVSWSCMACRDMGVVVVVVVVVAPTTQGPNCILFTTASVYTFP